MRRQILLFALALLVLCVVLTTVRFAVGMDYERLAQNIGLPLVWIITAEEFLLGSIGCAIAWLIGRAYNGNRQARRAFPRLARALAFSFLAYGMASLGDAVCHWLGAYWSLTLVKGVSVATIGWAAVTWLRGWPELRDWHALLLDAEGQDGAP